MSTLKTSTAAPRRSLRPRGRFLVWRQRRPGAHTLDGSSAAAPPEAELIEFLGSSILRVSKPHFADIATAYLHAHGRGDADEEQRRRLRKALPQMLVSFESEHGPIVRSHLGEDLAAAGLTRNDELTVALGQRRASGPEEVIDVLRRCERIGYTAWHRLHLYDRRSCQLQVWGVVEDALRLLDEHPQAPASRAAARALEASVQRLSARLDAAEEFMLRCAARRTQAHYLKGMLLGALIVGLLLSVALGLLIVAGELTQLSRELLLVAMAGAVGALFSVLARMTSGSLQTNLPTLDHDMKTTDLRLIASLRPAVGLVFALALYVLVVGGMVPLDAGSDATRTALLTGLGFLAGFSERLAQDVFIRSGHGLVGSMGDSPSKGPSAGLAPPPGAQR